MTRIQLPSHHPEKKSLCLPTSDSRSDSDASWWMLHKVDPHYDAYRRQKSSIRSCIGHKYVYVYEVGCRIVALKSWYLWFLPDTPETTFMNETLRNLDAFTVQGPTWHGLGPVSVSDSTTIRRLIVRSHEVSKQQCYRYVCQKIQNDAKT